MSTRELIDREPAELPESMLREVCGFARFLRQTPSQGVFNGPIVSESVLREDWDTPEEDAAWASL